MTRPITKHSVSKRERPFWELALVGILCIAAGCLAASAPADDEAAPEDSDKAKTERAARIEKMRRRAAALTVQAKKGDEFVPADLVEPPLLHYNNVAGVEKDATLWAWGKPGRPVAVASLAQHTATIWNSEMVSLSDDRVSIAGGSRWEWSPPKSGIEWKSVPKAPAVGKTAVARAGQMKDIAGMFTATGYYRNGNIIELRLMGRPLLRYSDPEQGLIDGSMFNFADGTNPEVFLLVECRKIGDAQPAWHFGFARMSGGHVVARLGDMIVWDRPDIQGWNPQEPYTSMNGSIDEVFGPGSE